MTDSTVFTDEHVARAVVRRDGNQTVVAVVGEHDCSSVAVLAGAVDTALALTGDEVVVDLSAVGFMDASTITAIVRGRVMLAAQSRRLLLRAPSMCARRIVELCGMTDLWEETTPTAPLEQQRVSDGSTSTLELTSVERSSGVTHTGWSRPARGAFARTAFNDLPVAVLYFHGSSLIDANTEWFAISGRGGSESAGDGWLGAIHPDDRANASASVGASRFGRDIAMNVRIIATQESTGWFRGHLRCFDDPIDQARLLTLTAVGAHRSNQARLVHLSTHDELTGLANRTKFTDNVTRAVTRRSGLAGLLFIDLDHFKVVNDHLGHRYGDDVLRTVGSRIESAIRSTDLAGRLGGDEIGVFCPCLTAQSELVSLAARIGEALATPITIGAETVIIDASIGVAFTSDSVQTAEALIDTADRAMYVAKAAGGGRWATLDTPRLIHRDIDDDEKTAAAIRGDLDRAEERTRIAWQRSIRADDVERAAQFAILREALRRTSLLLRSPGAVTVETSIDHRPEQLQSLLDGERVIAQAVGMITQHTGTDVAESADLLRRYATAHGWPLVTAASNVVERSVDVDTVATAPLVSSPDRSGHERLDRQIGSVDP